VAIDFRADPLGSRVKGWQPRGQGSVKLVPGWEPRPEYGAGQIGDPFDPQGGDPESYTAPPAPPQPQPMDNPPAGQPPAPTPLQPVPKNTAPVYTKLQTQALSSPAPTSDSPRASTSSGTSAPQTLRAAGNPPAAPVQRTQNQQQFLDELTPTAKQVAADTGMPWQVLVAIPANETGWGSAVFHNNYFGEKGPGASARTWEVVNGQRQDITDSFKTFDSPEASMRSFVAFVHNNPRYKDALDYLDKNPSDWPTFVHMLNKDGYATDPDWADKVTRIGQPLESSSTQPTTTMSPGSGVQTASRGTGSLFDTAKSAIGSKYVWGGPGGRSNFDQSFVGSDCSGFVAWAYRNGLGVTLPAFTGSIWAASKPIDPKDAVPGDLIMFGMNQSDPAQQHVAIYEGNGMMIHDSSLNPNGGVQETPIWNGGSFRRVTGVNAADLSRATSSNSTETTPASDARQSDTGVHTPPTYPAVHMQDPPPNPDHPVTIIKPSTRLRPGPTYNPEPIMGGGQEEAAKPEMSKKEASYTKKAQEDQCQDCSMFRANTCSLVKGYIHDQGSCDYFEPKKSEMGAGTEMGAGDAWYDDPSLNVQVDQPAPQEVNPLQAAVNGAHDLLNTLTGGGPGKVSGVEQATRDYAGRTAQAAKGTTTPAAPDTTTTVTGTSRRTTAPDIGVERATDQAPMPAPEPAEQPLPAPEPAPAPPIERKSIVGTPPAPDSGPFASLPPLPGTDVSQSSAQVAPPPQPGQPVLSRPAPAPSEQPPFVPGTHLPTLKPDNPITNPSASPMDKDAAIGDALATTVLPDSAANAHVGPVSVHDLVSQALRPSALLALPVTGASSVGMNLGEYAATQAAEQVLKKAGATAAREIAPALGKVGGAALDAAVQPVGAAVKPLVDQLSRSPFGKFLTEDSGIISASAAMGHARDVLKSGLYGAAAGGALGAFGDISQGNPQNDPNWWSQVAMDAANDAKFGGELGLGLGVLAPMAQFGWDHSVGPGVMHLFREVFTPLNNLSLGAQDAYVTRANRVGLAAQGQILLQQEGEKLFGKPGTGLNTAEAAAWLEDRRTLAGYVGPNGERANPAQELWARKRLMYEDSSGVSMRAQGILSPTQDVVTPVGAPGPSAHVMHLYDDTAPGGVQYAKRKSGLGWSDTVTHRRVASNDPLDPSRPRTLREALDQYYSDPIDNPKPLDDLVTRFSTSFYQTERAFANREAWVKVRNDPDMVARKVPGAKIDPTWRSPDKQWGLGQGQDQYAVHPDLATYLNNVTGVTGSLRDNPLFNALWGLNAPFKMVAFGGSPVHMFNIVARAHSAMAANGVLGNGVGELMKGWILPTFRPGGTRELFMGNPRAVLNAARAGVTLGHWADDLGAAGGPALQDTLKRMGWAGAGAGSAAYLNAKRTGASDQEAWDAAWKAGLLGEIPFTPGAGAVLKGTMKLFGQDVSHTAMMSMADLLHSAIFTQALPAAKVGMFDILTRNPSVDHSLAADLVNETLGGLDMLKIGRAPWAQDLMRFGLVSSDFEEGEIRTLWNAVSPGPRGDFTRNTVVKGMATIYGTTELLNLALNGHFTWDNGRGHEFDLETTGLQDNLADVFNQPSWRAVDPATGRATRTYQEVMPPLRWIMQTLGEGTRQLAYNAGQLEGGTSGQRLVQQYGGDPAKGDSPPQIGEMLAQDARNRVGFVPGGLGALGTAAFGGGVADYTGKLYDPPGAEPKSPWSRAAINVASVLSSDAPSGISSVTSNVPIEHPDRMRAMAAIVAGMGLPKLYVTNEISDNLNAMEEQKKSLGFDVKTQQQYEQTFTKNRQANDAERQQVFDRAPTTTDTHAALDKQLQDVATRRKDLTLRHELTVDYLQNLKDQGLQSKLLDFWTHVFDPGGSASKRPADTLSTTDTKSLADAYWHPQDTDATSSPEQVARARSQVLKDLGQQTGEHPDALEDSFKWIAQNTDSNGLSQAMPTLGHMTEDDLGKATTDFLDAGLDPANKAQSNPDASARADAQRQKLQDLARQYSVDPKSLLQRINLRLSNPDQAQSTGLQKSYNNALQTFFDSRDQDTYPRYVFPDGHYVSPDDAKAYDKQLAQASDAQKKYDPAVYPLVQAKKAGDDKRLMALINDQNNKDYERWFGLGRDMSEKQWNQYINGQVVGYTDLRSSDPKAETLTRDRIIERYTASTFDQRTNTKVTLQIQGKPTQMNLWGAYGYLKHFHVKTAGRDFPADNPSDLPPDSTTAPQGVQ